jgi:hypothetical protein
MADIKVQAKPEITKGKDLPEKDKNYGESKYDDFDLAIKMHCVDATHRNADYEPDGKPEADDEHKDCNCTCSLTEVDLTLKFTVRYNPKKIDRGGIDPKTKDAHDPAKAGDLALTEESVKVHETAHCAFVTEKIGKALKDALNKIKLTLFASCKCGKHEDCRKRLISQVKDRVNAIIEAEKNKVLRELDEDYRNSETEQDAREQQVKYLEAHPKK